MKKFIIFLIILSVLTIQCSNETSSESEKSKSEIEFIEDDADNFVYLEKFHLIILSSSKKQIVLYYNSYNTSIIT